MLAGAAVADWGNSFSHNPALMSHTTAVRGGLTYCRPYGLEGLDWVRGCIGVGLGCWSGGFGLSSMSFAGFRETDIEVGIAAEPMHSLAAGLGVHALAVDFGGSGADVAASFDVGLAWHSGIVGFGVAARSVNSPRFENGDGIPVRLVLAGSVKPAESFLLALDLCKTGSDEGACLGMEFDFLSQLHLRAGIASQPLLYAAGVGVDVGPAVVDYTCRFHPQLKETHVVGLQAAWR